MTNDDINNTNNIQNSDVYGTGADPRLAIANNSLPPDEEPSDTSSTITTTSQPNTTIMPDNITANSSGLEDKPAPIQTDSVNQLPAQTQIIDAPGCNTPTVIKNFKMPCTRKIVSVLSMCVLVFVAIYGYLNGNNVDTVITAFISWIGYYFGKSTALEGAGGNGHPEDATDTS
ncbi:MAG: hypothetical protein LBM38_01610 [Clostridiales bacterium]|nr:hypothetical protein [Clostridiales bacterium]